MNERVMLLRRLSSAQFAALEIKMFLDTHPCDQKARLMAQKYQGLAEKYRAEYEAKYGPLTNNDPTDGACFSWVNDPWPWEVDAAGGDC